MIIIIISFQNKIRIKTTITIMRVLTMTLMFKIKDDNDINTQ